MPRFRKKPVVVDAMQWIGSMSAVVHWLQSMHYMPAPSDDDGLVRYPMPSTSINFDLRTPPHVRLSIKTLEGEMTVSHGDWIIRGIGGEFYPCKPDIFEATYEVVAGDPYLDADAP